MLFRNLLWSISLPLYAVVFLIAGVSPISVSKRACSETAGAPSVVLQRQTGHDPLASGSILGHRLRPRLQSPPYHDIQSPLYHLKIYFQGQLFIDEI